MIKQKAQLTLNEARKTDRLEKFIHERECDTPGDAEKLDEAIKRPASQKSKEAPKVSPRRGSDD